MSHFQQNDINKIINRYQNINKVLSALQMLYIVGNNFITVCELLFEALPYVREVSLQPTHLPLQPPPPIKLKFYR